MGFSTSHTLFRRSNDGTSTPSFEAAEDELMTLALAMRESGKGAMQPITDFEDLDQTLELLRRLVQRAEGYLATIVGGTVVHRDGMPTGELPGRLVLGPQAAVRH